MQLRKTVLLLLSGVALVCGAATSQRPNLIFILADDLGYGELGCYGQQVIRTPHLDRMAQQGLRFTQFYAGATVCAPSRSVLMTGRHHGRTRVRGNAGPANPLAQALREEDVTVAAVLKRAGYATGLIGKWGLGDTGPAACGLPGRHGFDTFFGYLNQRHAHNHFPSFLWRGETRVTLPNRIIPTDSPDGAGYAVEARAYADDLFAEEVLAFVREHRAHPFFLFWSMVVPHANNERTRALRDGAEVPDYGPYTGETWPSPDKGHAAMITRMDGYVGRLLETLRELELDQNTLVLFTSDNGPHNESGHNLSRFQPSAPFTGIKRSLTEGGIRVPCLAWWPGRIAAGTVSDHTAYFGDWMATAAELAGVQPPSDCDSLSFVPTLLDRPGQTQHDCLYWEFHERGFRQAALHQGRWKAFREGAADAPVRLYDLLADPSEQQDVAATQPAIANHLSQFLSGARSPNKDWTPRWRTPAPEKRNP